MESGEEILVMSFLAFIIGFLFTLWFLGDW